MQFTGRIPEPFRGGTPSRHTCAPPAFPGTGSSFRSRTSQVQRKKSAGSRPVHPPQEPSRRSSPASRVGAQHAVPGPHPIAVLPGLRFAAPNRNSCFDQEPSQTAHPATLPPFPNRDRFASYDTLRCAALGVARLRPRRGQLFDKRRQNERRGKRIEQNLTPALRTERPSFRSTHRTIRNLRKSLKTKDPHPARSTQFSSCIRRVFLQP
jgi:hypothetical protein